MKKEIQKFSLQRGLAKMFEGPRFPPRECFLGPRCGSRPACSYPNVDCSIRYNSVAV